MVLIRIAALVALAACNQSLFDNHGQVDGAPGDAGPDADPSVPTTCEAPCAADLAADFNGSAGGVNNNWRYLDDHRDRTWLAMTGEVHKAGADAGNQIAACNPASPACAALPDALLFSTAGATSGADPAVELTLPPGQVIQLTVHAYAVGRDQRIRLYRNSREDVLFTGTAVAGAPLGATVTVDTLPGDRYLLAVAPEAAGGDVAVQLFAKATGAVFPAACQAALSFTAAAGNDVTSACGQNNFTHGLYSGTASQPMLAAGPFPELGTAGDFTEDGYYQAAKLLDKSHDLTVQLWVKHRAFIDPLEAWLFSDLDLQETGGLGIGITNTAPPLLDVETCATASRTDNTFTISTSPWPDDHAWHFIRVVHTGGKVNVCLDGKKQGSFDAAPGFLKSTYTPYLGANAVWSPQGAFLDGSIDDLRVLTGALPCE
jgi:hypothetical protein